MVIPLTRGVTVPQGTVTGARRGQRRTGARVCLCDSDSCSSIWAPSRTKDPQGAQVLAKAYSVSGKRDTRKLLLAHRS
jgi:hypothetical protein